LDLAPIILTPNTALVNSAQRFGVATPEQHDFFRQHRQHRIELAMEENFGKKAHSTNYFRIFKISKIYTNSCYSFKIEEIY
jgi:hypothetical protein